MPPISRNAALVLLATSALSLSACERPARAEPELVPPPVHLDTARTESWTPETTGTADLIPLRRATLSVEAPGRVVALDLERGQTVEAGAILLRLDVGRTTVAARAADAAVSQAEAALAQATRERDLAARLVATGTASQRSLEAATDVESMARAAVETARAQTLVTRRGLTEAVLRAPFTGVVIERHVEMGEYVAPGSPVAVLMDASRLRADVLLDPRDALDVRPGAPVHAEVFARDGELFEGEVLRVGEAIDVATRRLPVEVEIQDPAHRLRPGLVARFTVVTGPPVDTLTIDADAAFERFELTQVYVVDADGVAHRRTVSLGAVRDGRAAVIEGLDANERVVVEGQDRVLDGHPVTVVARPDTAVAP